MFNKETAELRKLSKYLAHFCKLEQFIVSANLFDNNETTLYEAEILNNSKIVIFSKIALMDWLLKPYSQHFIFFVTRPNKLECWITLVLKGSPRTNTLAFSAHS